MQKLFIKYSVIILLTVLIVLSAQAEKSINFDFYKACEKGDLNEVKTLFDMSADVNYLLDTYDILHKKFTPLHIACEKGNLDIVKFLVDNKANLNAVSYTGDTPIMTAAQYKHEPVVSYLVDKNAFLEQKNSNNETLLFIADANNFNALLLNIIKEKLAVKSNGLYGELLIISDEKLKIRIGFKAIGFTNEKIKLASGDYKLYMENETFLTYVTVHIMPGMTNTFKDIKLLKKSDIEETIQDNNDNNGKEIGKPAAALVLALLPPTNFLGVSLFLNEFVILSVAYLPFIFGPVLVFYYLDVIGSIVMAAVGGYNYVSTVAYRDTGKGLMIAGAVTGGLAYLSNLIITLVYFIYSIAEADFKTTDKKRIIHDMLIGMSGSSNILLGYHIKF